MLDEKRQEEDLFQVIWRQEIEGNGFGIKLLMAVVTPALIGGLFTRQTRWWWACAVIVFFGGAAVLEEIEHKKRSWKAKQGE